MARLRPQATPATPGFFAAGAETPLIRGRKRGVSVGWTLPDTSTPADVRRCTTDARKKCASVAPHAPHPFPGAITGEEAETRDDSFAVSALPRGTMRAERP